MGKAIAAVFVAVTLVFGAIALSARGTYSAPREIRVVARDMTFYLEGHSDPNPTLRLRAGETVRLVLRNEDDGMRHDLAIPGWNAASKRIESGEETTITFRAPDHATEQTYRCRPHARMMRGTVLVE